MHERYVVSKKNEKPTKKKPTKKSGNKKATSKSNNAARDSTMRKSVVSNACKPLDASSLVPELLKGHSIVGNDASFDCYEISNKIKGQKQPEHDMQPAKHEKKRHKMINQLLEHLSKHPDLFSSVTKLVPAPDGTYCANFFKVLSGDRTPQKENLLNDILEHCMQVGGAMDREKPGTLDVLQPGAFNNCMKCLFAELNSHNINYQHEKDFKGSGKLQKVINKMFADNFNKHGVGQ